jgi:hypothetical protein
MAPRHWLSTRHPHEPRQYTWRNSFMSHANQTGVTEKSQIQKNVRFISRILIKKYQNKKKPTKADDVTRRPAGDWLI